MSSEKYIGPRALLLIEVNKGVPRSPEEGVFFPFVFLFINDRVLIFTLLLHQNQQLQADIP